MYRIVKVSCRSRHEEHRDRTYRICTSIRTLSMYAGGRTLLAPPDGVLVAASSAPFAETSCASVSSASSIGLQKSPCPSAVSCEHRCTADEIAHETSNLVSWSSRLSF
eukprot:6184565-Pleurochrysis_carterae.AAC.2